MDRIVSLSTADLIDHRKAVHYLPSTLLSEGYDSLYHNIVSLATKLLSIIAAVRSLALNFHPLRIVSNTLRANRSLYPELLSPSALGEGIK